MKKVLLCTLVLCCSFLSVQASWKKITLPEGKNLFPNGNLQAHPKVKGALAFWSNYSNKRLKLSHVETPDGKVLRVTSSQEGYHLGLIGRRNLKPDTEYCYYILCRGKIKSPKSKIVPLYAEGRIPGKKRASIVGAFQSQKKDFPWTLFKRTIKTPSDFNNYACSFYMMLVHGIVEMDIAAVGLVEVGPAFKALPPLNKKYKNLLNNSDFAVGKDAMPYNWNINFSEREGSFKRITDKDGSGVMVLLPPQKKGSFKVFESDEVTLRQGELQLNPGKKYRLSAWIKTEDLTAPRSGLIVYNYAWGASAGIERLPANTNGWKLFEKDIVLPKSRWETYSFGLYTVGAQKGKLYIKKPSLIPVDDEAAAGIVPAVPYHTLYKITPVDPLLSNMDADTGKMTFSFDYVLPGKESDYLCFVSVRPKGAASFSKAKSFPLKNSRIHAVMGKLPAGDGSMRVQLKHKKTGKILASEEYLIRVQKKVKLSKKPQRLNMLTQRLLNGKVSSSAAQKYLFSNPRRGWVWIRVDSAGKKADVKLNNVSLKGHSVANGWETSRLLEKGDHTLILKGLPKGTAFRVHAIPEIFAYSYPWTPGKAKYEAFRKEFVEKYVFPTITSVNHGYPTRKGVREHYASYGKKWFSLGLHNYRKKRLEIPEVMAKRFADTYAKQQNQGMAFDEIFINSILDKWIYTQALRRLVGEAKPIYTWSSGVKFMLNGLNADYFSATANNGRGTGKYLFECYARTQPDEKTADTYLEDYLNETMRRAVALMPRAPEYSLIILGGYTNAGQYNTDTFAGPDVKSFWDKFFFRLANDKEFRDLYGVGIYCYHHSNEESFRWWSALIRHYCFEGRTESLAQKYGYKYMPGHIRNGDFTEKFAFWTSKAAEKDSLQALKIPSFGNRFQARRGLPNTTGDHVSAFKRSAGGANTLSTKITGLTKGKLYVLRYLTVDRADVKAKKPSWKKLGLFARFDGAKDITASSGAGRYTDGSGVFVQKYVNNCAVVFRAEKESVTLTFSDWKDAKTPGGPIGQEILLNKINVTPYFSE